MNLNRANIKKKMYIDMTSLFFVIIKCFVEIQSETLAGLLLDSNLYTGIHNFFFPELEFQAYSV
jgi:hypothetical protein